MVDMDILFERLREFYTLKLIAQKVGVHVQTVYMWKMGTYRPSEANMKKLLELLDGTSQLSRTQEQRVVEQTEGSTQGNTESSQLTD